MDRGVLTRSMRKSLEWWYFLPQDLNVKIFCLLPVKDVATSCALVCRTWRYLSSNETLWKKLCERVGLRDVLDASHFRTWRSLFGAVYGTNLIASPHFERIDRIDAKLLKSQVTRNCEPKIYLFQDRLYFEDERHEEPHSFCHWIVSGGESRFQRGGGDGIIRESPPAGCRPFPGAPEKPVLATSYDWGEVFQGVDLRFFPRKFLDLSPPMLISAWYAGRYGSIGLFRIQVGLCDKHEKLIFSTVSKELSAQPNEWKEAKLLVHGYPKGMRTMLIKFGGMSVGTKKGFHGAKYTAVQMKFITVAETVVKEDCSAAAIYPSITGELDRVVFPKRA